MTERRESPLRRFPERLRAQRRKRGLGLRELAQRAQVTPAMISMIERGKIHPSVDTLHAIADALHISLVELFDEPPSLDRTVVVQRVKDRPYVISREGRFRYDDAGLVPDGIRPQEMEPALVRLYRNAFAKHMVSLRGDQLIYGLNGSFSYACGDETFKLESGDSLFFHSHEEHGPVAIHSAQAEYVVCYTDELYGWLDMRLDPRNLFIRPPQAPQHLNAVQRLAWRIRYARSQRGYLQTTVRAKTGLSYGMVSHIESGRSKPSLATLEALAQALNVPMAYFFDDSSTTCRAVLQLGSQRVLEPRSEHGHRFRGATLVSAAFGEPLFVPECRMYERKGFVPELTQRPGQFFFMVLDGVVDYVHGNETFRLDTGDTIYGVSQIAHGVAAVMSERAHALVCRSNLTHLLKRSFSQLRHQTR